jgi:hypothetical protein
VPAPVGVSSDVRVVRFESEPGRPALHIGSAWLVVNGNRFDVVCFIGDSHQATIFYTDTQEADVADRDPGTS